MFLLNPELFNLEIGLKRDRGGETTKGAGLGISSHW